MKLDFIQKGLLFLMSMSLLTILFLDKKEIEELKQEVVSYQKEIKEKPYLSISRLKIDSISPNGTIFAMELHAGEAGSSGDYSFQVEFDSCHESGVWLKYPYLIPDKEVYSATISVHDTSYTTIITPNW